MESYKKKFNVLSPLNWSHHRGGWPFCVDELMNNIHNEKGIDFYTNGITSIVQKEPLKKKWSAIFHVTPGEIILDSNWEKSLKYCIGAYALCQNTANYLSSTLNINCETLYYPVKETNKKFSLNCYHKNTSKKILHVGHWLRNVDAFIKLKTKKQKELLNCLNLANQIDQKDIKITNYLPESEYDDLLSKNIIFLNLNTAGACTVVMECIERNTPIVINKLSSLVEYLGEEYPLFYKNLEEASLIIENEDLIKNGHEYLKELDKTKFEINFFIKKIVKSSIYKHISIY